MAVRFWTWRNDGRVRITLSAARPKVTWERWYPTDEGSAFESTTWYLDGDTVHMETFHDERDCDGRIQYGGTWECRVDRLDAWRAMDGFQTPDWTKTDEKPNTWQRDFAAEAAGY